MNFDNKNAIKRVTPCKFLWQIMFCNVEFAQNCRKFEFSGEKIEFHGKKSSFAIFGQNEFPSKRTKKKPEFELVTRPGTKQTDAVLLTGSKHLKSPFQPIGVEESLHLSRTEFTPYQVSLSCNSVMECSIDIKQNERTVLKQEIGHFGPFIQPNIATFR